MPPSTRGRTHLLRVSLRPGHLGTGFSCLGTRFLHFCTRPTPQTPSHPHQHVSSKRPPSVLGQGPPADHTLPGRRVRSCPPRRAQGRGDPGWGCAPQGPAPQLPCCLPRASLYPPSLPESRPPRGARHLVFQLVQEAAPVPLGHPRRAQRRAVQRTELGPGPRALLGIRARRRPRVAALCRPALRPRVSLHGASSSAEPHAAAARGPRPPPRRAGWHRPTRGRPRPALRRPPARRAPPRREAWAAGLRGRRGLRARARGAVRRGRGREGRVRLGAAGVCARAPGGAVFSLSPRGCPGGCRERGRAVPTRS